MSTLVIDEYTFVEKERGVYFPQSECKNIDMLDFGADADSNIYAFTTRNPDGTYDIIALSRADDDDACTTLHRLFDPEKQRNENAYYYYLQNYARYIGGLFLC